MSHYKKYAILLCLVIFLSVSIAQAQQALGKPQNVYADKDTIYWDAVANAKDYRVHWASEDGAKQTVTVAAGQTQYAVQGLQAGLTYIAKVRARGDGKNYEKRGKWSESVQLKLPAIVTTLKVLPAPGNIRLVAGSTVAWDAVAGVNRYRVRLDPPNAERILKRVDPPQTQISFDNLQAGLTYTVRVRAMGDEVVYQLLGAWSDALQIVVPLPQLTPTPQVLPAPGNLRLVSGSTVAWDAVAGADRYRVRLDPPNGNRILKRVDPPQTQFTFDNLQAGLTYTVRVRAMGDEVAYQLLGNWSAALQIDAP
ncbi:MAG: fibronectin type III domain-containing protein [Chloroflexota bacterium]|nr:fibronectin type III domain-containing protein [Chloroflexota bacterium]MDE2857701.1 fibronectin type III domain-containing protein [Chloroflexota bacterium]